MKRKIRQLLETCTLKREVQGDLEVKVWDLRRWAAGLHCSVISEGSPCVEKSNTCHSK